VSNLLGDFFTGSTMLGADPDEVSGPWHSHIVGKTRFITPKLSVSDHLTGTIVGRAYVSGVLTVTPGRPMLSATIVGHTIFTPTFTAPERQQFVALIVGNTELSASLSHEVVLDFQGTVGAAASRSLLIHGQVLSGTGLVKPTPIEDEQQPVHFFV
jgi:hypothetical protein